MTRAFSHFIPRAYIDFLDLSFNQFKKLIKDKLVLFYKNQWLENMQTSSKCFFYKEFKKVLTLEKYLINTDVSVRYFLC